MSSTQRIRFRQHSALTVAAAVAVIGGTPMVLAAPWLAPLLLLPLGVAVWSWRAGTDASADGLRVRALFGARVLPWSEVAELAPVGGRRVAAVLTDGGSVILTAVTPADLPRLLTASGHTIST